jgi:hypothetical protein
MLQHSNPLAQFFRQPAIYLRLPSGGHGWAPGSLDLPDNGEIPVYPMTAMDEITYRTPDALFNGEATVSVMQSCVPNIKDAWSCPASDLDTLLIGIRIASYGHSMDIGTKCPSCETDTEFGLDLRTVIDKLHSADYESPLQQGDLKIYFKPLNYRQLTDNAQAQFEQQKTLQIMGDTEVPEESKVAQLNTMMKKIVEATITAISRSISEIRTRDAIVTESKFIEEFLHNCERVVFERVRDHVVSLRETSEIRPIKITCPNCQHQYDQSFTLDMARFFESAS